jgi:hypothetical protein
MEFMRDLQQPGFLNDSDRFNNTKERYGKFHENLAELRNRNNPSDKDNENHRSSLNTYLEQFNNEFPEDALRLSTYHIYTSKGKQVNFSFSSLEFIGSNVDTTI